MCVIGYLEGTDPLYLSKLVAEGYDTMPLSNGADNHGKYIGLVTKSEGIEMIVGFFHKIVPPIGMNMTCNDILYSAKLHKIPVILVAPAESHDQAIKKLGKAAKIVTLITPEQLWDTTMKLLKKN